MTAKAVAKVADLFGFEIANETKRKRHVPSE